MLTAATGQPVRLHRLAWTAAEGRVDAAKPWNDPATFHANGTVPAGLALAGPTTGVLAGLLLRRATAALAAAVVALGALWAAADSALPYLWPTVTEVSGLPDGPTGAGVAVGEGIVTADGDRAAAPCHSSLMDGCRLTLADLDAVIFHRDFHPAGHYWPLQPAGTGILLLVAALSALAVTVAALATAAAFAPLNRRTA